MIGYALDGRYEIVHRLARGGMATVYLATDRRLTRDVAVKVMHVGMGHDDDFAVRFDREARAAARLSHPNVVSVFDQGHDLDRSYIVMEYVPGRTLRHLVSREAPVPPLQACELMEPILCALAVAHEAGLVHRDIKPENVLLSDRGAIKVADFGLSKAITAQSSTATNGVLIGTVSYLPPELVTSGKADARSDVYSAGIVLFELLTGRKPHTGDTPIQVAYAHVHNDVPSPSQFVPDAGIPAALDALVCAATSRDPARRPSDGHDFTMALRRIRRALSGMAPMPEPDTVPTEVIGGARVEHTPVRTLAAVRHALPPQLSPVSPLSPASPQPAGPARSPRGLATPLDPEPLNGEAHVEAAGPGPYGSTVDVADPDQVDTGHVDTGHIDTGHIDTGHINTGHVDTDPYLADDAYDGEPADDGDLPVGPWQAEAQWADRARYRRRRGLVALLVVVLLALGIGTGAWWTTTGRYTTAPDVTELSAEDATAALTAAGFGVVEGDPAYSETVPAGAVISTDPVAGDRLLKTGTITLTVSLGPERYEVPKLAGTKLADARDALSAAHLSTGKITEAWDEKIADGVVVSASLKPGTSVKPGTAVDLVVSKGRRPIKITDYTGEDADKAKAALTKAGFKVKVSSKHSETVAKDKVISQSPHKGQGHKGDTVKLVVSLGPPMVTVPPVKANGVEAAKAKLTALGFKVVVKPVETNYLGLGYVSYSDPSEGTSVRKGSTITLYVV